MSRACKWLCQAAATVLLSCALMTTPAKAQFPGAGGGDMMTQMAPMLEMMKAKMGKRRFARMMQTMGPMMAPMMDGGGAGLGGLMGGGIPAGLGDGYGLGGIGGGELMSMMPPLMSLAHVGGGRHSRRHRRR